MEYIGNGAQADVYKDGSKAIKLFKYNINKAEVEYEVNLQKTAFDFGLPVPKIYDIIEIDNKFGIVMEYIEGIPVGNIILEDMTKLEEYLVKSIEIQNNIHKIETKTIHPMKDKLKYFISKADLLSEEDKNNILLKLENKVFENKLCHGDFHVLNLMQTSNEIKIIDWICASSGNPEADIYRTYLLYKMSMGEFAEHYLNTYCEIINLEKTKILSWSTIVAAARLGEYVKDKNEERILLEIINKQ
jgi:uncharacterized protein (TIGR02172 family)